MRSSNPNLYSKGAMVINALHVRFLSLHHDTLYMQQIGVGVSKREPGMKRKGNCAYVPKDKNKPLYGPF